MRSQNWPPSCRRLCGKVAWKIVDGLTFSDGSLSCHPIREFESSTAPHVATLSPLAFRWIYPDFGFSLAKNPRRYLVFR